MKKSASSISLEELNLLAQKSDSQEITLKNLINGMDSDSGKFIISKNFSNFFFIRIYLIILKIIFFFFQKKKKESQFDERNENGIDENYTMEGLIDENSKLQNQNKQMQRQIEDLRHLLLQVFSDTRSILLTEDTIQQHLNDKKKSDDENEEHEDQEDHEDHDDHEEELSTEQNSINESKEDTTDKSGQYEESKPREEPDIEDLPDDEDYLNESDSKLKKKLRKKMKKTKPKKQKSVVNQKGRSKAKKKLKKHKKKTKKKKLLKQLFVGTKGILFGSHKMNKQPEALQLKLKIHQELSKYTTIVKETETKQIEQLLLKEKQKGDFNGFYFCNLGVVVDKWILWKKLMPRVKPFYAVKVKKT